jgi:hypothetical protein
MGLEMSSGGKMHLPGIISVLICIGILSICIRTMSIRDLAELHWPEHRRLEEHWQAYLKSHQRFDPEYTEHCIGYVTCHRQLTSLIPGFQECIDGLESLFEKNRKLEGDWNDYLQAVEVARKQFPIIVY